MLTGSRLEVRQTQDPMPDIGEVIDLDEVPDALERARRSEGPLRIVVHPNG
jgi:hypothetical protein